MFAWQSACAAHAVFQVVLYPFSCNHKKKLSAKTDAKSAILALAWFWITGEIVQIEGCVGFADTPVALKNLVVTNLCG